MPRRFPLLLALTVPLSAGAQAVPDTTMPWRYFPLHVGDEWQYQVEVEIPNACYPCRYTERRLVTGVDTLGEQTYFRLSVRRHDVPVMPFPPSDSSTRHVRFDTVAAAAVHWVGEDQFFDGGGCRLDEAFPAPADSAVGRPITCPSGAGTVYGSPAPTGSTFGTEKAFTFFTFGWQWSRYLAGVGLLSGGGCEGGCYQETLAYARVEGVEYGTPVVATEPRGPEPGAAYIRVHPNPVRGRAVVTVNVPERAHGDVAILDMLARELVVLHRGRLEPGSRDFAFDASLMPPGMYIVRLLGAQPVNARIIIVR